GMRSARSRDEVSLAVPSTYSTGKRLRASEWALIAFFVYIAGISPGFPLRSQFRSVPFIMAVVATGLLLALAYAEEYSPWREFFSFSRDWFTLILVLTAYREMDW